MPTHTTSASARLRKRAVGGGEAALQSGCRANTDEEQAREQQERGVPLGRTDEHDRTRPRSEPSRAERSTAPVPGCQGTKGKPEERGTQGARRPGQAGPNLAVRDVLGQQHANRRCHPDAHCPDDLCEDQDGKDPALDRRLVGLGGRGGRSGGLGRHAL